VNADLEESYLGGVKASGADFGNACLKGAVLQEGDFTRARFQDASLEGARAMEARFGGAVFGNADLRRADLTGADLRQAKLTGAVMDGAVLTGAKVAGVIASNRPAPGARADWLDTSGEGNGSSRAPDGALSALVTGTGAMPGGGRAERRYFGSGDVLRNATLQLGDGARVEIDSLFENCVVELGPGTSLVVGKSGVLADCRILGGGDITIHGHVFERESPGIVRPRALTVTSQAAVVASVEQAAGPTHFAFERGSRMRLKILKPAAGDSAAQKG
jgi:hypothetical protein